MDNTRNVGVRFIEPAGKLPRRKEIRNVGVQFIEPAYGLDESSPYRGKANIRGYSEVVERILLCLPERFSGLKIDFYVLMPTHLHVIFVFDGMNDGLPEVVRTFMALVTRNTCRGRIYPTPTKNHLHPHKDYGKREILRL